MSAIRGQGGNYFARPQADAVRQLLADVRLPTSDLTAAHLQHFIGCGSSEGLQGVIGLELYANVALLRSLAVAQSEQRRGLGRALLAQAESHAREHGAKDIYLLTTTAERFFARAGYERIARDAVPEAIRATSEFSTLCPASAAVMRKRLE